MTIQSSSINWKINFLFFCLLLLSGTPIMAQEDALKIEPDGQVNIQNLKAYVLKGTEGTFALLNSTSRVKANYIDCKSGRFGVEVPSRDDIFQYPLYIGSTKSKKGIGPYRYLNFTVSDYFAGRSKNAFVSIYATGRVITEKEFNVLSDQRIKRDFAASQNVKDLQLLNQLVVTDYRYKDIVQKGNAQVKGFVAQQVEEVFPQAVSTQAGFIPDIYAISKKVSQQGGQFLITLEKAHQLKGQEEVQLIVNSGKKVLEVEVIDDFTFAVNDWEETLDEVFVFGKKVDDFRAVNYDAIFTLGVSATQELSKQVEMLKAENEQLQQESTKMAQQLAQLQASVDQLLSTNNKQTLFTSDSSVLIRGEK